MVSIKERGSGSSAFSERGDYPDLVEIYLREIGQTPLLTPKEEKSLARLVKDAREAQVRLKEDNNLDNQEKALLLLAIQRGKEPRGELAQANLRLVASIAKKYTWKGLPFLDLIQLGSIGLLTAIDKYDPDRKVEFDPTRTVKFSTYATHWIHQSIQRGLDNQSETIRAPAHVKATRRRIESARERFISSSGQFPSSQDLALASGLSLRRLQELLPRQLVSLEQPLEGSEILTLGDAIESQESGPEDEGMKSALQEKLQEVLSSLSPRERTIISLRMEGKTLEEIARGFNLTRERIRQIEVKALGKLRTPEIKKALEGFLYK